MRTGTCDVAAHPVLAAIINDPRMGAWVILLIGALISGGGPDGR
jgi:hypothetical protein